MYSPPCMPRLLTKWNKGRPALSGGRSARVKGQARLVEQSYLGLQERGMEPIRVQRTAAAPQGARPTLHTVPPREGGAAALCSPGAQELGRLALIKADIPPAPPARRPSPPRAAWRRRSLALVVDAAQGLPLYCRGSAGTPPEGVGLGASLQGRLGPCGPQHASPRLTLRLDKGHGARDHFPALSKAHVACRAARGREIGRAHV